MDETVGNMAPRSDVWCPRVSIGIPVYNGENYVAEAVRSILAQTYRDIELVISDNASTDGTEAICREFAAADPRVRYYRSERNIGLGPNFNHTFELARGTYFKWACHDDLLEPTYLEKCVAVLDTDPGVVLCHSTTRVIGKGEGLISGLVGVDANRPSDRFAAVVLRPHWSMDIHGLIRTDVLRRVGPMGSYYGADKALLAGLALLGRFARVSEPLFINRDHAARSMRAITFHERLRFHDPRKTSPRRLPSLMLYSDYFRTVRRHAADPKERLRCYRYLLQWWFMNWHWARFGSELLCLASPRMSMLLFRMRERYHRVAIGVRRS